MSLIDGIRHSGEVRLSIIAGDLSPDDYARLLANDDEDLGGRVLTREVVRNLVTNTGRADITGRIINGGAQAIPSYFGIGTTVIAPAASDTTLTGETTNRKALSTIAVFGTYYERYAVTYAVADFNLTVRGVALFTSSSGGDMWAIASTNTAKSTSQALVADWRINTLSA